MRHDLFHGRKSVHVNLEKNIHAALRSKLFKHNISMQEILNECAKQIAEETKIGNNIVEIVVKRKLQDAIEGRSNRLSNKNSFSEIDSESLYSLLNSEKEA